jgi:hypothetical protein
MKYNSCLPFIVAAWVFGTFMNYVLWQQLAPEKVFVFVAIEVFISLGFFALATSEVNNNIGVGKE